MVMKSFLILLTMGAFGLPFLSDSHKSLRNALLFQEITEADSYVTKVFSLESSPTEQTFTLDDLLSNIPNFVDTPEGGTSWRIFGETGEIPYIHTDEEGQEWDGVRPVFSDKLKELDGKEILIQGYMFPLGQEEKQSLFLLGPFPVSCPYHYHVRPNLIIEAHAESPVAFSFGAVNIKGQLELVPKDDQYNVFYRLKDAELVP